MTNPKVTVLMPVYNSETYISETIQSILNQTFTEFEFVIIDDGSTDSSGEIAQSYDDSRIRYFENDRNMGLIFSLNRGLTLAQSPYIARIDADDVCVPTRLAKQVDFLDAHPDVGVLGSAVQVIDDHGNLLNIRRFPIEHNALRWLLCFDDPIAHPAVMMRRDIVRQVGGYSSDMVHAEDYDLWRRLSSVTRLANLPDVLLCLRRHENCVTKVHHKQSLNNSVSISTLMISEVLGEEVPTEIVRCFWRKEFRTSNELRLATKLILRLCKAFVSDDSLSGSEKKIIRRDASSRLLHLFLLRTQGKHTWEILGSACLLDPLFICGAVKRRIRRVVF